jgi:hypothetical protein
MVVVIGCSAMAVWESFDGIWWSVEVPPGWRALRDAQCATFHRTPSIGAFQISSARKEAAPITNDDLKAFAINRIPEGAQLLRITYGQFSGFTASFRKDGSMWREWWLGAGKLMVYATYNVVADRLDAAVKEQGDVESILATLKPNPTQ